MAKGNDKKIVRRAHELLLDAMGNLLESHHERTFREKDKAQTRAVFCARNHLPVGNVAFIETGRFLEIGVSHLRHYLATTHGRSDQAFATSVKKVYDGLKEMGRLLDEL